MKTKTRLDSNAVTADPVVADTVAPGRSALTTSLPGPVQRDQNGAASDQAVHQAAAMGVASMTTSLPHREPIQRAFGHHDISHVQAHTDSQAQASASAMGAQAYATGNHVVLGDSSSLHTVAHEAAHVVQQKSGVQLSGGVGQAGDKYEQHADAVADAVVAGHDAAPILDSMVGGPASGASVQSKAVQREGDEASSKSFGDKLAMFNNSGSDNQAPQPAVRPTGRQGGLDGLRAYLAGGSVSGGLLVSRLKALKSDDREGLWLDASLARQVIVALAGANSLGPGMRAMKINLRAAVRRIVAAGVADSMNGAAWCKLVDDAPDPDVRMLMMLSSPLSDIKDKFQASPRKVFARFFGTKEFADALVANAELLKWYIDATSTKIDVLLELGSPGMAHGSMLQKIKAAGKWPTLLASITAEGVAMPRQLRTALYRLLGGGDIAQAKELFQKRFKHALVDNGGHVYANTNWTLGAIQGTWKQLDKLPDQDCTSNTALTVFNAVTGGGGSGPSWEHPASVNSIQIGQTSSSAQKLAHTVRHEVGHAVHLQIPGPVNAWLKDLGVWFEGSQGDAGIRWAIQEFGGWGVAVDADHQDRLVAGIKAHMGNGGVVTGPAAGAEPTGVGNPIAQAAFVRMWGRLPDKVKDFFTQSCGRWWDNHGNWIEHGGKKWQWNRFYNRPHYFKTAAANQGLSCSEDSTYTLMSEKEYFAQCYAEYFKDESGFDNHERWGGALPTSVKAFFKKHILERQPYGTGNKTAEGNAETV